MPKKYKNLFKCQCDLWKIRKEIESYAALFQSLGELEIHSDHLQGFGMALGRIAKKISHIHGRLDKAINTIA